MSICIPRVFENISEARVRNVFDALDIFTIARVDLIKRVNDKGDKFQRVFIHIKDWTETANAQKAKERLLAGKELKIVYDDPWFWKASLNNWTPSKPKPIAYDRKPRIHIDFGDEDENIQKNTYAASALLSDPILKEDNRPYRERRIDPVYCEQDVNQGFRDRRQPKRDNKRDQRPREYRRSRSRSPVRNNDRRPREDQYRDNRRPKDMMPLDTRDYRDGFGAQYVEMLNAAAAPVPAKVAPTVIVNEEANTKTVEKPAVANNTVIVNEEANTKAVEKPAFKPRVIESKEQKEKRRRANQLLAAAAISPQIIYKNNN
jgi:hypothetical protein